jgi:holin-like protein
MLAALTQLLIFQLLGEVIARGLDLPVPGPVIGMLLLFLALVLRRGPGHELQTTSQNLLQHLSLLFVPAGTGIMVHMHRIADEWQALLLSLLVSTAATLIVTALVMKLCLGRTPASGETP